MKPSWKYLAYGTEDEAIRKSRLWMKQQQTEETQNDPETVTLYLFLWRTNEKTGKCSLIIPPEGVGFLYVSDQLRLRTLDQAILNEEIEPPKDIKDLQDPKEIELKEAKEVKD